MKNERAGTQEVLTGYSNRWSVTPGQTIDFMVSSDAAQVDAQLVRLLHGDTTEPGPGFVETDVQAEVNGLIPGGLKSTFTGSYVVSPEIAELCGDVVVALSLWPTLLRPEPQTVVSAHDEYGFGWALRLTDGQLVLVLNSPNGPIELRGPKLSERQWSHLVLDLSTTSGRATMRARMERGAGWTDTAEIKRDGAVESTGAPRRLVVAAEQSPDRPNLFNFFNGKVDSVRVGLDRGIESWASGMASPGSALLSWDFSQNDDEQVAVDAGPLANHGRVVNAPTRTMTGPRWRGSENDPRLAPHLWSAIHFHEDDLDDARWPVSARWRVPDATPSGIYALRLRANGLHDHLVFVVRPLPQRPTSRTLLLMPTLTYMAYANERVTADPSFDHGEAGNPRHIDHRDVQLRQFPEWGKSVYDVHVDGSGVCYSSRLRPIPNFRPDYRFWCTGGPERLAADLYIAHFFFHHSIDVDVVTDQDLHDEGVSLLTDYDVVVTGTHPEYWTADMLTAIEDYLQSGGQMMYLGGNGFYWVTSVDPNRPHLIEVRRGFAGTRTWTSQPGEANHSTTKEPGGLWRFRGKDPNKLVGVGFAAQNDTYDPAAGYTIASDLPPDAAFILDGVELDESVGSFGLINGGAAGYEIDRVDHGLGSPERTIRLASSEGQHHESYLLASEDIEATHLAITGQTSGLVRADMAYLPYPNGGAVFSVGSVNWGASLSWNNYQNNVARITLNVLRSFLGRPKSR